MKFVKLLSIALFSGTLAVDFATAQDRTVRIAVEGAYHYSCACRSWAHNLLI
jgi:octopine/nopaline transport system substrate-binding protein